jgi:hypothetical protein
MKKSSSSITARATLGALLLIIGIALLCSIPFINTRAQNPSSGTVGPAPGGPSAGWDQTIITPGGGVNTEAACVDGTNCEVFTLTVNGPVSSWAGQKALLRLTWQSNGNEYDIYIHQGASVNGTLVRSAASGPGLTSQTTYIDPATDGTGTFTIHIVPDTTPVVTDKYHGSAIAVPLNPAPPPPAPQDAGPKIGYENFTAPGVLVPVTVTSAGQQPHSVEYMGRNGGEPSVGSNWATGVANFQSDLQTLFITFDDNCPLNGLSASWVNRSAPSSTVIDSDPIGFTDRGFRDALNVLHSRVWAAELTLLSPNTVKISYTDDDGVTWVGPDQPGGIHSAVDHETIGGGPYHAPIPSRPPGTIYPNAIYYCSQDIAAAFCSRSDDGGLTYGPSVAISSAANCGLLTNLHGHVKVTPDTPQTQTNGQAGTVYVPNRDCNGVQSVIVSQDNGTTWTVHPVQNSSTIAEPGVVGQGDDPAVGIDNNGRVYFSFSNAGTAAAVATSDDTGATWNNIFDVGAVYGIKNACFATAVGGSANRAAVAYYGSTTPQGGANGDSNTTNFTGVWHLIVAHTFDGGAHWTTTDATPNAPMQRSGILRGGGADIVRNLLDFFDITIDNQGRVLVGYVDGCEGGNCKQAAPSATGNAYTVTATIARQSSGRRMLATNDPGNTTSKPGMPSVTQRRVGATVHLAWSEADTGNSFISSYQILRGIASNGESLLATVPGTSGNQIGGSYTDLTATDITKTYYYKVVAVNGVGPSCGNNEIAAPYVGDACTGIVMHKNDPTHPEANAGANTPASLLIDYIAVGEPASSPGSFMFKMKVNDLGAVSPTNAPPPNSRWRIMWDSAAAEDYPSVANDPVSGAPLFAQQFYVGMTTGPSGPPTFEYGTLADAGAPAVFVISETTQGSCTAATTSCVIPGAGVSSQYNTDGTITIFVPKTAFGRQIPNPTAPALGSILGAVGGRTLTGDVPGSPESKLERSNAFIDHTFIKAQQDSGYPAATYTVAGNGFCNGGIGPITAVSRKTHGTAGTFDVDLPLTGTPGIECRQGQGPNLKNHQVVFTFAAPVTFSSITVTPAVGGTGAVASTSVSGNQVTVNLNNVSNAQTLTINLNGLNSNGDTGNISWPMAVLLGDVNATRAVDGNDVSAVQSHTRQTANSTNFRFDVNVTGGIDGNDVSKTQSQTRTSLP